MDDEASSTKPQWRADLAKARTTAEILAFARDYMERLDPWQREELTDKCKPPVLITPLDLSDYAYELKRAVHGTSGPAMETLEELSLFFSEAASRASVLASHKRMGGFSSTDLISYRKTKTS